MKAKNILRHKCYYRSLFLYTVCRLADGRADYRINIMMHCAGKAWGHAWLTRNGNAFAAPRRRMLPFVLEKIGESKRYVFWITT